MSDGDITNLIRREIARAMANQTHHRAGLISSYDGKGKVKVTYQPDGNESGWLPIGRHQGGQDVSIVHGPSIGDQVVIGFLDGDMESGFVSHFLHSDVDPHPAVASGETLITHKSGSSLKIDKDGHISMVSGGNFSLSAKGTATFNVKGAATFSVGSIAFKKG